MSIERICLEFITLKNNYHMDAVVITWLLLHRKGGKGRLEAGMPFTQLCPKAASDTLQVCSPLSDGGRDHAQ